MFRKNQLHSQSPRRRCNSRVIQSFRALTLLIPALASHTFAQQNQPVQNAPIQNAEPQSQPATSDDRLFKLLPNFLTLEDAGKVPPLKSGEKFKTVARGAFDWGQFVWYGLLSGISQAENSEPGFGQGAEGYGKRYGAYFADGTIENFMVGAIFPSMLRQDPRFYLVEPRPIPSPPALRGEPDCDYEGRFSWAARNSITRRFWGLAVASGTQLRLPSPFGRTIGNTASVWGTQVAYDTLSIVFKEFWPDIRGKIPHKQRPTASSH